MQSHCMDNNIPILSDPQTDIVIKNMTKIPDFQVDLDLSPHNEFQNNNGNS